MSSPKLHPPKLEDLLRSLRQTNRKSNFLAKLEIIVLILLLIWLPWPTLIEAPLVTSIIIGLALVQSGMGYFHLMFQNKKEIRHLQDHSALGNFHRQDLLELIQQVLNSMGYKNTSIKVYLLGDKDVNASAIKVGFSKLFPSLNAIYLNRSVLHLLKTDELKFLIGHEFAHVLKYRETWRDYEILHICMTAIAGLWALCLLNATEGYVFFVVLLVQLGVRHLLSMPSGRMSRALEYLCDYNGMKVSSLAAAVNASLKLGHESEAHQIVFFKIFEASKNGQPLSPREIHDIYQEALPYGSIDAQKSEQTISKLTQNTRQQKSNISFKGWLDFIKGQDGEDDDFDQDILQQIHRLKQMPILPWREKLNWDVNMSPQNLELPKLLSINEHYPDGFLFRLESEIPNQYLTHPSFSNRIKFLAAHQHA
jgi:Zn-dependent protease with chaperone function